MVHNVTQFFVLANEDIDVLWCRTVHVYIVKSIFDYSRYNDITNIAKLYRAFLLKAVRKVKIPEGVNVTFGIRDALIINLM